MEGLLEGVTGISKKYEVWATLFLILMECGLWVQNVGANDGGLGVLCPRFLYPIMATEASEQRYPSKEGRS